MPAVVRGDMVKFLNQYATGIITVSFLTLLLDHILPAGNHKKYVNTIIGLIVMLVVLKPITMLPQHVDIFDPALPVTEESQVIVKPYVAECFEKNLALYIADDLHERFNQTVACRVSCLLNEEGQIMGVRAVHLVPYDGEMAGYVATRYGIEEACIQS
ncbi:MAG: hypothetical protein E7418_02700 [Ruminococcaceae bacterium]|nr:hypothetical protein [Oscillospiraceae bacterium]